jgi:hypothetical protein
MKHERRNFDSRAARQEMEAISIKSVVDGVDVIASKMECKWGIGRLRLLVSYISREKFDRQSAKFNAAIEADSVSEVRIHGEAMKRAWKSLDEEATQAGAKPLSPEVWEVRLPTKGDVIAFVRTEAEAHQIAGEGREVYTAVEIAIAIESLGSTARQVKQLWPGAKVERVEVKKPAIDWQRGDDLPLNL